VHQPITPSILATLPLMASSLTEESFATIWQLYLACRGQLFAIRVILAREAFPTWILHSFKTYRGPHCRRYCISEL
jgi:hypothetical protein